MAGQRVNLSGRQKAAAALLGMGQDMSAKLLKHLSQEEVRALAREMVEVSQLPSDAQKGAFEEFVQLAISPQFVAGRGPEYVHRVLAAALGEQRASEILDQVSMVPQSVPFEFLRKADAAQLLNFVRAEQPQAVALVLAHVKPEQAAYVLSQLPVELQTDIAHRIATLGHIAPEVVKDVESVLQSKVLGGKEERYSTRGGVEPLAEILQRVERGTESAIIEGLERIDPALAEEVRSKMFVFDDLVGLDDRALQQVLMEVSANDLALALKKTSEEVKAKIFKNMSQRAREHLEEEMELLGPQRVSAVEEAQQKVVATVRRLEAEGRITISRAGEEEELVE